jgi:predicted PurR-regulated permease PerM
MEVFFKVLLSVLFIVAGGKLFGIWGVVIAYLLIGISALPKRLT